MSISVKRRLPAIAIALAVPASLMGPETASAQITRLIGEIDPYTPPGGSLDEIYTLSGLSANGVGAYVTKGKTFNNLADSGGFSLLYGRPDATTPDAILYEETPLASGGTTYFRKDFGNLLSYNSPGQLLYESTVALSNTFGAPEFDSMWLDDDLILFEGDPISGIPGQSFSGFSVVGLSDAGAHYYEGRFGGNQHGLFSGTGVPILKTGDVIGGTGDVVLDTDLGLGLGNTAISPDGAHYITDTDINPNVWTPSTPFNTITDLVILNGTAASFASSPTTYLKDGTAIPAADGGIGDAWEGMSNFAINNAGKWGGPASTSAADNLDWVIVVDGAIIAREGDSLPTEAGGFTTLTGQAKRVDINDDNDVAFTFGNSIFINGVEYITEGDLVDNGETLTRIQSNLDITDRDENDNVTVFFTGRDLINQGPNADTAYSIELTLPAITLPGDLDGDGFVGIDDLNLVLSNWNQNVPPGNPLADPSGDGFVGIDDLNEVLGNWNAGTPPTASAVPEPATFGVLMLAGAACLRRSRH